MAPLPPGSTIGILGGGQLGRMLSLAASRLGFQTHIYCPDADGPAARVSAFETVADYEDTDALELFSASVDCVTYEFENVPAKSAKAAASMSPLYPNAKALKVSQDRLLEKKFISEVADVPVATFENIKNVFEVKRAAKIHGLPAVLKTRRFGYDGKGQVIIRKGDEIEAAFGKIGGKVQLIFEAFIPFEREVSVIAARSVSGEMATYPLIENVHKNHILHTSTAPAERDSGRAQRLALNIMTALDYVGVMATEFFEMENGDLIVNEIAPRVHNSGHWTQDAGCVDQFELHIRAIAGWPLGNTHPRHRIQMTNLIGSDANGWESLAREPNTHIHLYGKKEAREGRKMGHVNRVSG